MYANAQRWVFRAALNDSNESLEVTEVYPNELNVYFNFKHFTTDYITILLASNIESLFYYVHVHLEIT